jgi:hypothetical protein
MTEKKRLAGTGTLIVKGADEASVRYEITTYVANNARRVDASIEAGRGVIEHAFRASGAQLRLDDGRVLEVQIGNHSVTSDPAVKAELIINTPL